MGRLSDPLPGIGFRLGSRVTRYAWRCLISSSLFDRSDYPTLSESIYLNQASLGLIGRPSVDAMHQFLDGIGRHGNLYMSDEDEVGFLDALRQRAARLFQTETRRIAILSSASELLGQLPFMLPSPSGAKVVAVATDFPAITRPWLFAAARGQRREPVKSTRARGLGPCRRRNEQRRYRRAAVPVGANGGESCQPDHAQAGSGVPGRRRRLADPSGEWVSGTSCSLDALFGVPVFAPPLKEATRTRRFATAGCAGARVPASAGEWRSGVPVTKGRPRSS